MIQIKKKLTLPEYRERQEVYKTLGYKEVNAVEKGYHVIVTYEVDETDKHYSAIRHLEKKLYRKGPSFLPVILFVGLAFVLLSDFFSFSLAFVYTYLYFNINKRII